MLSPLAESITKEKNFKLNLTRLEQGALHNEEAALVRQTIKALGTDVPLRENEKSSVANWIENGVDAYKNYRTRKSSEEEVGKAYANIYEGLGAHQGELLIKRIETTVDNAFAAQFGGKTL